MKILSLSLCALLISGLPPVSLPHDDQKELVGRVVDDQNPAREISAATVVLKDSSTGHEMTAVTNEQGMFRLWAVTQGRYKLRALKQGFVPAELGAQLAYGIGRELVLGGDARKQELTLIMTRAAAITGTITDPKGLAIVGGSVVALRRQFNGEGLSYEVPESAVEAVSNQKGQYRIYGLPPGTYAIAVDPPALTGDGTLRPTTEDTLRRAREIIENTARQQTMPQSGSSAPTVVELMKNVRTYHPATADLERAVLVTVRAADELAGIDITRQVVAPRRLSGAVISTAGLPPTNLRLWLRPGGYGLPESASFAVHPDGSFQATGLVPGQYVLGAEASARYVGRSPGLIGSAWGRANLEIREHDITGLTISLESAMRVTGRVSLAGTASSGPIPRLAISLVELGQPVRYSVPKATSRDDGSFTVENVAGGSYAVALDLPAGYMLNQLVWGQTDVTDTALIIKAGRDPEELRIIITQENEVIGKVTDLAGSPATTFVLILFSADAEFWTPKSRRTKAVRPDDEGSFRFAGIPPGIYLLAAVPDIERNSWFDPTVLKTLAPAASRLVVTDAPKTVHNIVIHK